MLSDPQECKNLIRRPENDEVVKRLKTRHRQFFNQNADPKYELT